MLQTYYDQLLLDDLLLKKPADLLESGADEWRHYYNYLKSQTDLVITGYNQDNPPELIKNLVSGRGDSKITWQEQKINLHKGQLPSRYGLQDVFFLTEDDPDKCYKYRQINPNFFGFYADHLDAFKRLSLFSKNRSISIRKEESSNEFSGWEQFGSYLLPFSDCILIDNYLFANGIEHQNFGSILVELAKATSVKFNLIIITYEGDNRNLNVGKLYNEIEAIRNNQGVNADITLIATKKLEHDRHMIMNYLSASSLGSFNYLNTKEKVKVNTKVYFNPYTDAENFVQARNILNDLKPVLQEIFQKGDPKVIKGGGKIGIFSET